MLMIDADIEKKVQSWINGPYDSETKETLQNLLDKKNYKELTDAFYKDLEFGTGGLRGILGPGTNRVNKYTFGMATQGLCNYLLKAYPDEQISVVIARDSRNKSDFLAGIITDIFSGNGIKVYYFEGMRPTPQLSFAIRHFGSKSGVMVTASHNPREYNGYKAYGPDGGQVTSPADQEIIAEVRAITEASQVNFSRNPELVEYIDDQFDVLFQDAVLAQSISKDAIKRQSDIKIVFTPLHGVGAVSVPPVLEKMGFTNVVPVSEQMVPDGDFPTLIYPNPEEEEAMTMALNKAKEIDADLVLATDPDADRVGIAVKNLSGEFVLLNGNQTAALIFEYVLNAWETADKLDEKCYIISTIVTSNILDEIAKSKNVECFNTLTGFKHIGAIMTKLEDTRQFVVGGEESYGYLVGDHARDKDAIVSCAILAEMCAYYKDQRRSMYEALMDIHQKYGLYVEKLISIRKEGKEGAEEIQNMMTELRADPPKSLAGSKVKIIRDYLKSLETDQSSGTEKSINLSKSNVLQFITEDGSIISARPSGTEPKIKFYCSVNASVNDVNTYDALKKNLSAKIDSALIDMGVL